MIRVILAQVIALCQAPFLLDDPNVGQLFPPDAIVRAKHYLSTIGGGLGMHVLVCTTEFIHSMKQFLHKPFFTASDVLPIIYYLSFIVPILL